MIKVGSDFSGVGAFNQSLIRLGIEYKELFACDMDKYARQTFIHNYGEPEYYPTNVYDRAIPNEPLDIYMTSPPCQAFSLAGKRLGKDDKRGILFFNSHEFIQKNKPRYFIFENVKGLLSDNGGNTFSEWVNLLGGKSINGNPVLFPYDDSVPYHLYWKVLNAKHHGVPQNRERVFIVGIRDDKDNNFTFPPKENLTKTLKDILEPKVEEKYYLSEKMIEKITFKFKNNGEVANLNKGGERGSVYGEKTDVISCLTATDYKQPKQVMIEQLKICAMRGRNIDNPKSRKSGLPTQQMIEVNENGVSNSLTTVQKDNLVVCHSLFPRSSKTGKGGTGHLQKEDATSYCIDTGCSQAVEMQSKIRKLTPIECFRLMDFPDTFTWPVSDSQAYKQAGNSIVVNVLYKIIKNLKL